MTEASERILVLTTQVVTAYVGANAVDPEEVPGLIRSVHAALSQPGSATARSASSGPSIRQSERRPGIDPEKSVFPTHIICLEDGKKFTMLKRHLSTEHGLTPEEYRAKWDLPRNYPMVAPNYANMRSALAKATGLGRRS
jgi:predicted transcriptional regulator